MEATAHRCFPRDLVRFPGGKCRDVVPKCGGRVAHDEVHCVSPLDSADADSKDTARFSCGLPRRGARRYREPPSTVARHPGPDPARRTADWRHEDGSALYAELTADADSVHTHLLLYLFHQWAVGIVASDSQAGSVPWRAWLRATARLHRRGCCGGCGCVAADPTQ